MALFFLPTYALIAGLMIALGSLVADHQQAQQLSSLVTLPFMLPFFFMVLVFTSPNSPLLVALTLFPPTAFTSVAMRWGMTAIPIWQLVLSWVLLVATALASIAFAARVFRLGMLRYGQGLKLGELAQRWGKVRSARAVR
jgi:ABC-2 type transport system permease protein